MTFLPIFLLVLALVTAALLRRLSLCRSVALSLVTAAATAASAFAAAVVNTPTMTFTAAESGRTFMTVGGVWNGSAEVTDTTGDTFSVTFTNSGDTAAFDFAPRIILPTNFTRVGTLSVSASSGSPAISGTPGTTGTIDVNLGGYDLPAGATLTLTFGAKTSTSIASGTYQFNYTRAFAATDGGALGAYATNAQQNVLVQAGDTTINITPKQQTKAVGENATFTVTVTNTGLGGLFDVTINESAIYPTGNNLQFVSLTKTAPALSATSSNGGSILTLPYLAPGATYTADVVATVLSCGTIVNNVTSVHRANSTAVSDSGPVQLDLRQPLVAFTPPAVSLDYNTSVPVTIPVQNTGLGSARVFRLQSTLNSLPLTVSNLGAGWSYDSATGLFTYTANSGVIANGASVNLTFNLLATDPCTASGAGTATYTALYENGCGDAYTIPIQSQNISAPSNAPTLALAKTVSATRIAVLEPGTYTLTLSATNIANIGTANVTVTDTLPAQVDYVAHSTATGAASYNAGTRTLTWTVPVSSLTANRTLAIDFAVGSDPCNAGLQPTNTASTTNVTTSRGCTLNATAGVSFLISNNPGLAASQFFNTTTAPASGAAYETGNADAAPLGTRGTGEGEFIPFAAGYTFGAVYPGTWAGSTYTDGFGGVTQMVLSSGSLTVESPGFNGGAPVAVPAGSITTLSPGFRIDLGFLAGASYFNNANVAGKSVTFRYRATAPDSAISSGVTRAVTQLTTFVLAGAGTGTSGACNTPTQSTFTQGVFYTLARAQAQVGLSLPSVLEVCKDELLTLTVSNANSLQARNVRVTLLNSGTHYTYDTSYTPAYGGAFNSGNITYAANSGVNPTFTYTGNPLAANGTIQVRVRRIANGTTTPGALTARVDYDSWQTAAAAARVYNSTGSYTPSSVRKANLAVTVTPGSLTVTSPTVTYVTYVSNTDAGTAYGTVLTNTLPVGITVNTTATNAANPAYSVTTSSGAGGRQVLTWALGNIASGATIPITLVADVGVIPGCSITLDSAIDRVTASWGCDSNVFSTVIRTSPAYVFPSGKMQVVHDSTQTVARLCDPGKVVILVKNTGPTNIQGVTVQDVIPPSAGLSINGTVQYRINGGSLQNALAAPTGTGASGSPYTWTSAQIPALAELVPVGVSGTNLVTIEITLASTETLASQNPVLSASASATISCGGAVSSPAQPFTIPVERPEVSVAKTGRNITANPSATFGETVYGGQGDVVEWKLVVTNNGDAVANNLRLSDQLSGSGGTAVISGPGISGSPAITSGQVFSISSLGVGASATYTITEVLGSTCVSQARNANISWGCTSNGATTHSNVTTPGTPSDPATIVMLPDIAQGTQLTQTVTSLPGGRARVVVNITNNGGTAYNPVLTATIPAGSTLDATGSATFGGTVADITGFTAGGTASSPVFTFTGPGAPHLLRYGESMSVTYYVRPTVFDTQSATSFTAASGSNLVSAETTLDPTAPATANLVAKLDFTTSCGAAQSSTNNASFDPLTPDLDVTATSPTNTVITGTGAANYTFTISNNGDAGSLASHITADFPGLGSAWTINSVTVTTANGGTGGTAATLSAAATQVGGVWTFSPAQLGTLGTGGSIVVTVNAAYSGTPGPLGLKMRVTGESRGQDGSTAFGNYSLDQRGQRVVGAALAKTLLSTSEAGTTTNNVLVGEEATYRVRVDFFGVEDDLASLVIADTPADSNTPTGGHLGLSYISHVLTAANEIVPASVATPTAAATPASLAASRVTFNRSTLTASDINSGVNTFEADITVRVLNVAANTDAKALRNNFGVSFSYLGNTFRSNDADDGFTTGTTSGSLHAATDVTVRRPQLNITKTARNVTRSGSFAASAPGEAGDVIEYRVVVSNPASNTPAGQRPLYGITVTDTVPAKLNLSSANQGADTNSTPASIEVANTAGASGLGAVITFNQTNTPIATAGSNFTRLDPGQSITLLYRGTLDSAVVPNEILSNSASVLGYSLPLPSGSQTAPAGVENTESGATRYSASATAATVVIDNIVQQKLINSTSVGADTSATVLVGEQIRYRVALQLPQGTVPDLQVTDQLPAGLALVSTPVITFGAGISPSTQPTITPASLPANGSPLNISWSFGSRVASGSNVADRTVTIEYVAQVRNLAANVAGATLVNNATYSYSGAPVNLNQVTATVAAPNVTVTRGVRNATRNPSGPYVASIAATDAIAPDTGDLIEYQISITNASGATVSSAYDLAIQDTLPAGLTYVDGWAGFDTLSGVTPSSFPTFEPDKTGQVLAWGRIKSSPVNIDLAPGGTLTFHYRARVDDTGRPLQDYTNATVVDWTSLDGAPGPDLGVALASPGADLGERNGTGTSPNTYRATGDTPVVARNSTLPAKAKSADTLPRTSADALGASPSGFRVGDIVTYTVTIPAQEATLAAFQIRDTLPAGLAFLDTVSLTPAAGAAPFAYTTPVAGSTAPSAGATGSLLWDLGTLVNAGDNTANDTLTLVYRARVVDPSGIAVTPADQTLSNTATARYTLADTTTHTTAASIAAIVARQPILSIAKDVLSPAAETINGVSGLYLRRPGDTASFRVTVTNSGTAPAYNIRLTDTLPAGLRGTAPVLTAATLNGAADLAGLAASSSWDNSTGAWVFNLADGQLLLPGQTLVLTYTVTVNNDNALKGTTQTNSATVNQFFSLPSAHPEAASRRQYAALTPVTRSLVIGLRIDGSVYHDAQPNNAKDSGEDWSGAAKPTVYANLVAPNNTVVRTVTVAPGTGAFSFDYLPAGSYTIVVTNGAEVTTAQRPANWLFQFPTTGSIAATLSNATGDLANQDLGLNQGIYAAPVIAKAKSGDTLPTAAPATGFRIGDLVTYTVTVNPQEGALTGFAVTDVLPAGLAFNDTVSITPASGGRYTYTAPSGATAPASGATGTLTWNFGAFTNAISGPVTNSTPAAVAAANTLTITYRARVRDNATGTSPAVTPIAAPAVAPASTTTAGLVNSAALAYTKPAPDAGAKTAGPATATVQVEQARLTIAKVRTSPTPGNLVAPGGTATFQVTVTNDGSAPAYNTRVTDTLPSGMRGTAPTLVSVTLGGSAATVTPTWTSGAGTYVFNLSNTQLIQPGQSLVLTYTATVDAAATRGATLTNSATINQYFSKAGSDTTQRRQYAAVGPATASVVVGIAVSGFVYSDLQPNNTKDSGEDWSGSKPTVFVNLLQSGAVVSSATVAPGTGAYSFANLPAGAYSVILTDSAVNTVATRPVNWPFQSPSNGTIAFTLSNADLIDQNLGLYQGTLAAAQIAKAKSGDTLPLSAPASGFRVGDLVTYTVDIQPQEGSFTGFTVTDALPAGLAFVSTTSISQVSGTPRFTYTTPAGANTPAPGATGTVTWSFGTFVNASYGPADNTLRIVYTARVIDSGGVSVPAASPASATVARVNSAGLSYVNEALATRTAGPATASINIAQPRLTLAKTRVLPAADNVVMPGANATFRLTIANNGAAPAYNVVVADTLPDGMRDATPTVSAATLNGASIAGSLAVPAYDSGTGLWTVSLSDAQILLPGESLVIDYQVTLDADAPKAATLTNSATVTSYASKASADATERRVYAPVGPSTQNLIVGLNVAGSVYHQLTPDGVKGAGEDWTSGVTVFVNLVANSPISLPGFTLAADQVLRSVSVPAGPGAFSFSNVPPGDYRIIVTNTAAAATPVVPATWTFDSPSTGSVTPVAVVNADIADRNLGLYQGRVVSGQVYRDLATYGVKDGGEDWTSGVAVVVNLVNTYGAPVVHASAAVAPGTGLYGFTNVPPGSYRLVVAQAGQTTATTAAVPTNWVFVEPVTGTRDSLTVALTDLTDQDFGLTPGRTVSGFVYNDTTPNGSKDGFEDWTTGAPVFVNLVRVSDGSVFASASVGLGTGAYQFTNVPPGAFRIIVANGAGSSTVAAPSTWLFRSPPDGALLINVAAANLVNQNFGLFRGRSISGIVFRDNGEGGGTANNGSRQGGETGLGNVTVRLLNASLAILDTTRTDGSGAFRLRIPAETVAGATLIVEETNPANHLSTGATVGSAGGSYARAADRVTLVFPDDDVTGLQFGDVPESALLTDGAQTILPGATAFYRHTFRAGTAGTVVFAASATATPADLPWTQVIVRDLNCNGQADAGEPIVDGQSLTVAANEEICLVLKDNAPANAGYGARHQTTVSAAFAWANVALNESLARQDLTTVGTPTAAGLQLVKAVDKTTAKPGEILTYTITYTNAGAEALTELFIDDRTPHYTVFSAAAAGAFPNDLTAVAITAPVVGEAGAIRWTFTGTLAPAATGTVTFQVKVQE